MYRMAVMKQDVDVKPFAHDYSCREAIDLYYTLKRSKWHKVEEYAKHLPYPERHFIAEIKKGLDVEKVREVIRLFEENECHFNSIVQKKKSRMGNQLVVRNDGKFQRVDKERPIEFFKRKIEKFKLIKVDPPYPAEFCPEFNAFDFYVFEVTAKSFFHNQVSKSISLNPFWNRMMIQVLCTTLFSLRDSASKHSTTDEKSINGQFQIYFAIRLVLWSIPRLGLCGASNFSETVKLFHSG